MEKVISPRNDDDREIQRFSPGQHVGERNGFVVRAMNDDRVAGDRPGFILARTLDVPSGSAHQHQPLRRMTGLGKRLRDTRLHIGAEGKTGKRNRQG